MRTFWEKERPSSSEEDPETENSLYPENKAEARICSSVGSIEIVKDLNLSNNELKSEVRKLEYKINRLKIECEVMKNKSQLEIIQLGNELKLLKERYHSFTNCEFSLYFAHDPFRRTILDEEQFLQNFGK